MPKLSIGYLYAITMKRPFPRTIKITVLLLIVAASYIGFKMARKYSAMKSLDNSALGTSFSSADWLKAKTLTDGQLYAKRLIDLSKISPLWSKVAENDSLKAEYKHLNNLNFFAIAYKSDTILVHGMMAEPKKEGTFPVVIFNRGGNKEVGKIAKVKTLYTLIVTASKLAEQGYVVIASCYRENDEFGGADIHDVLNLTKTAHEIEKADPSRMGMFGWSRGGMMTYLALQKSNLIAAAAVGNGPSDLSALIIERPEMETEVFAKLIPNYQKNKEEELRKRSVVYWPDELNKNSSLLIVNGTQDKRVNPNQAEKIAEKLEEIDYDFELRTFDTDHSFSNKHKQLDSLLIDWFARKL